jgi:hypothetical protein
MSPCNFFGTKSDDGENRPFLSLRGGRRSGIGATVKTANNAAD